ncbi:MAG: glycosyltransferase family 39 protein, partial [Planctomycetota bacterium]
MRTSPNEPAPTSRLARLRAPLLFLALAFALYANAIGNGFVFDDDLIVSSRANLRSLEGVGRIVQDAYRPVRHVTYAIDYALFGRHAWGFHLSNVLYHALASFLVFRLVRRLRSEPAAWAAALLFAVHPVQTEAVAYVSGRRDLLVTIFFLLGFLSYLNYRDTGRWRHVAALVAFLALGAGSKESAATLPAVLLLHDLIVRPPSRRGFLFHVPFVLLAIAFGIRVALGDASHQEGFHGGSALTHYLAVPCLFGLYLWRFVMPV